MTEEPRKHQLNFRVSDTEYHRILDKMKQLGIRSIGLYLRKMALDGYCIQLELPELRELIRLLRYCSNNLNQYARKANESGAVYQEDIHDLQIRLDAIWKTAKGLLQKLSEIQ